MMEVMIIATEAMMYKTVLITADIRSNTKLMSQFTMRRSIRAINIAVEIAIYLIFHLGLVFMILRFLRVGESKLPAFDLYV